MFLLTNFAGPKKEFQGVKYDKVESNDTKTSNKSYIQRNGEVILKWAFLVVNLGIFVATTILFVLSRSEQRQVYKGVFSPASDVVEYHCLDYLVRGVMCSADISPISWSNDDFHDEPVPDPKVLHTCRNFEKIWEWSNQHRIEELGNVHV